MSNFVLKTSLLIISSLICGCTLGPDYQKPDIQVPEQWHTKTLVKTREQEDREWWERFNDATLAHVIKMALQSNLDLKIAEANILQSRASLLGKEAGLFPIGSFQGSLSRSKTSKNALKQGQFSTHLMSTLYSAEFDASWEIDFWGKYRRDIELATYSMEASVANAQGVLITLIAEIAQNYIELRTTQKQLAFVEKTYRNWKQIYELNQDLYKAGFANNLTVSQAKAAMDNAYAAIQPLKATIQTTIYNMSTLVGNEPVYLYDQLKKTRHIPQPPREFFIGIPAQLILRRPDIRSAERNLAASTASIGVAIASAFPSITLTGSVGQQTIHSSNFFTPLSRFFSFGPGVSFTLLDFGRLRAEIESMKALRDQAYYSYKKAILVALQDVESALTNFAMEETHYNSLKAAVTSSQKAADLSLQRYKSGLSTLLDVLNDQNTYYTAEINFIQSEGTLALDAISVYKALGGGWQSYQLNSEGRK